MIDKHMLRDRAEKIDDVTEDRWEKVNSHNKEIFKEFLDANKHLSPKSIKQYTSALRIFFTFICENLNNKPMYQIKKRDFIKYFSFLQEHKLSSSALKFKKSAVSSICNYIENVVAEEEDDYKNFRNPTKAIKDIPSNSVYEKIKITKEEYDFLVKTFEEKKQWLYALWCVVAFNTAARKAEIVKFKSEIGNYSIEEGQNFAEAHVILAKGRAGGKPVKYLLNQVVLDYINKWLKIRGYEHEYIFTVKYNGVIRQMSENWAGELCSNVISPLLGRRINPHIFRASASTYLMEQGKDIASISKHILHHDSLEVTQRYLLRNDSEDKNKLFE